MILTGFVGSDDEKSVDNISANSAEIGDACSLDSSSTLTDEKLQILIKYESSAQGQSFWAYGFTIVLGIISVVCFHDFGLTPRNNSNLLAKNDLAEKKAIYDGNDFENNAGILVPYWENGLEKTKMQFHANNKEAFAVGPCYLPKEDLNWSSLGDDEFSESRKNIQYRESQWQNTLDDGDLTGLCRPGFIIIGAGKCGTSSLYHYLVGHPRVLPAKKKQIDYFRYFSTRSMKWYLSNFPSADTFLSNRALMTGEASPGYLVSDFYIHYIIFLFFCFVPRIGTHDIVLTSPFTNIAIPRYCPQTQNTNDIRGWPRNPKNHHHCSKPSREIVE